MRLIITLCFLAFLAGCGNIKNALESDTRVEIVYLDPSPAQTEPEETANSDGEDSDTEPDSPDMVADQAPSSGMDEEEEAEEEEAEEEEDPPPTKMAKTPLDMWMDDRNTYNITSPINDPMVAGQTLTKNMTMPTISATYVGPITGTIAPNRPDLTNPSIQLDLTVGNTSTSINAKTFFDINGARADHHLSSYGARVEADGSFSSFSDRENMMPVDGNPTGFNGNLYGTNHEVAAGRVISQHVFGTYEAEKE